MGIDKSLPFSTWIFTFFISRCKTALFTTPTTISKTVNMGTPLVRSREKIRENWPKLIFMNNLPKIGSFSFSPSMVILPSGRL